MALNNAFLVTENYSLGTELDDGLRVGPVTELPVKINTVTNTPYSNPDGSQATANPYDQWGRGMLLASTSCYNIIPRGPSAAGNVVGYNAAGTVPAAGNLTLSADAYVTTANPNGDGTSYLQLDWPRALSVTIGTATLTSAVTLTVFGQDFYGAFMQESITIPNGSAVGTYNMKKAFYQIFRVYSNSSAQTATIQIQTTDTFGLPYRITSPGNIMAISWGNGNDMGIASTELAPAGASAGTSDAMTAGVVTIATTAISSSSQIQYAENTNAGAIGKYSVTDYTANTSFEITSNNNAETSTVNWALVPSNWASGTATLVDGTVFVSAPSVTSNSNIMLSRNVKGGTEGFLAAPSAAIVPGIGFTINSYSAINTVQAADTSTVNWAIVSPGSPLSGSGKATLVAGTITVPFSLVAGSTVLVSYDTPGTAIGTYLQVPAAVTGTSFTITSQNNTETSIVNWQVFAPNAALTTQLAPLGTFTPADQSTPSNTTGDVRGTYKPSTPANGTNLLDFIYYVYGFDNYINQQANAQLSSGGTAAAPAVRDYVTFTSQFGQPQYYTGVNA